MKASENPSIDLSLRVDLANAAIAYADSCVEYSLEPSSATFDDMMDAEELLFDLIAEARDAVLELDDFIANMDDNFVPAGWSSITS